MVGFNPGDYEDAARDRHEEMRLDGAMNILKSSYEAKREDVIKGLKGALSVLLQEGEFSDKQKVQSELMKILQGSAENNISSMGIIKDLIANILSAKDVDTYKRYMSAPLTAEELNRRYIDYVITKELKELGTLLPLVVAEIEPEFQSTFKNELDEFRFYIGKKLSERTTLYEAVISFIEEIRRRGIAVTDQEEDRFHRIAEAMYKGKTDATAEQGL